MNNLDNLRNACFQVNNRIMLDSLHAFISSLLCTNLSPTLPRGSVRTLHPVVVQDELLSSIFSGTIVYYSTAYIDHVRFTTAQYAAKNIADDSSIVFKSSSRDRFGRILYIFTVDAGEPIFYVDAIVSLTNFECETSARIYTYDQIKSGSYDEETTKLFIAPVDIVEKCVFYCDEKRACTFYRFPTLEHSS